jgi:hypothetical protein
MEILHNTLLLDSLPRPRVYHEVVGMVAGGPLQSTPGARGCLCLAALRTGPAE